MVSAQYRVRKNTWWARALLSVGLLATVCATIYMRMAVEIDAKKNFDFACNEIMLNINARMEAHAQILRSAAALFAASDTVTRDEWHIFTMHQKVEQFLPGVQGIGFSLMIPPESLAQHLQEIHNQGFPDYNVKPAGIRANYSSIIYLEPFSGRNLRAFGYDMFSEPVRRTAMEQARDLDAATLSGKVKLVQETDQDVQPGALMYVPVYSKGMKTDTVADRYAALYGWVYSPYRMNDLMNGILKGWDIEERKQIHLQVYDDEQMFPDSLLYDSWPKGVIRAEDMPRLTQHFSRIYNNHFWHLRFSQAKVPMGYSLVYGVFFGGAIISLLLSGLFLSLLNSRFKAQQWADLLTLDLQQSENNFQIFFDTMDDLIFVTHPDGSIIYTNPTVSKKLGYGPDELQKMHLLEVHPTENRPEAQRIFSAMSEGKQSVCPLPLQSKTGRLIHVETRTWPGQWNGANCIFGVSKDLTREQEALQKFHLLFDNNPAMIAVSNQSEGRFTDVNDAFLHTFDYSREEIIGRTSAEIGLVVNPEKHKEARKQLLAQGKVENLHLQLKRRDGTILDGVFSGAIIESQGEKYLLTVMIDQTKCRLAESQRVAALESLQKSEDKYRALVDNVNEILITTDNTGHFTFVNPSMSRISGYREEEILGHHYSEFIRPDMREEAIRFFGHQLATGSQNTYYKYPLITKEGREIWLAQNTQLTLEDGQITGFQAIARDITERKRAEDALRQVYSFRKHLNDQV